MAGDSGNALGTRGVERLLRRLFNPQGPIQYAQRVGGLVQPSVEVRPQFAHEFRDLGWIPWSRIYAVNAVAAQFSYIEIQPDAAAVVPYDVIVLDIFNQGTGVLNVFEFNTTQGAGTLSPPLIADSEFCFAGSASTYGLGTNLAPMVVRFASIAAIAGTQVDAIAAGGSRLQRPYILRCRSGPLGATPNLVISGAAVNTAIAPAIYGICIPSNVGD